MHVNRSASARQSRLQHARAGSSAAGFFNLLTSPALVDQAETLLNATLCRHQGKGHDEQSMLRAMLDTLQAGELLVGDVFCATYFLLCALIWSISTSLSSSMIG